MSINKILEFYANSDNYKFNPEIHASHDSKIAEDGGKLAREFLNELKAGNKTLIDRIEKIIYTLDNVSRFLSLNIGNNAILSVPDVLSDAERMLNNYLYLLNTIYEIGNETKDN